MRLRLSAFAMVMIVGTALVGCSSGSSDSSGSPSPTITGLPTSEHPYTVLIAAENGDKVNGPNVGLPVTIYAFSIVDKVGEPNKKGEGHLVYYLDVDKIPTAARQPADAVRRGKSAISVVVSYQWKSVSAGTHRFGVQLVNNDGTPLSPPAISQRTLVVVNPTPSPSPTSSS